MQLYYSNNPSCTLLNRLEFYHQENSHTFSNHLWLINSKTLGKILKTLGGEALISVKLGKEPRVYQMSSAALKGFLKKEFQFILPPASQNDWVEDKVSEIKKGKALDFLLQEEIGKLSRKSKDLSAPTFQSESQEKKPVFPSLSEWSESNSPKDPLLSAFSITPKLHLSCEMSPLGQKEESDEEEESPLSSRLFFRVPSLNTDMSCETSPFLQAASSKASSIKPKSTSVQNPSYSNLDLKDVFNENISYEDFRNKIFRDKTFCDQYLNPTTYDFIVDQYLARFFKKHPDLNKKKCLPSLQLTALVIAMKTAEDKAILNSHFLSYLTQYTHPAYHPLYNPTPLLSLAKLSAMERLFLKAIDWEVRVNESKVQKEVKISNPYNMYIPE